MCLAQGPQRIDASEAQTRGPSVSSQALYHWATALPILYLKGSKVRITKLWCISVPEDCLISANSADLAEMPHYVAFQLGLQCLPKYRFCIFSINLFVCFEALHPSQQFFSHVRMISCLPGLNQYWAVYKVSCSRTQLQRRVLNQQPFDFVCLFCCFKSQVNSYGNGGMVSSPNHTFSWASLNKQLTSTSCTYFRL